VQGLTPSSSSFRGSFPGSAPKLFLSRPARTKPLLQEFVSLRYPMSSRCPLLIRASANSNAHCANSWRPEYHPRRKWLILPSIPSGKGTTPLFFPSSAPRRSKYCTSSRRPAALSANPMTENAFSDVNHFGRLPGARAWPSAMLLQGYSRILAGGSLDRAVCGRVTNERCFFSEGAKAFAANHARLVGST
jgi:hypothetical protein